MPRIKQHAQRHSCENTRIVYSYMHTIIEKHSEKHTTVTLWLPQLQNAFSAQFNKRSLKFYPLKMNATVCW